MPCDSGAVLLEVGGARGGRDLYDVAIPAMGQDTKVGRNCGTLRVSATHLKGGAMLKTLIVGMLVLGGSVSAQGPSGAKPSSPKSLRLYASTAGMPECIHQGGDALPRDAGRSG